MSKKKRLVSNFRIILVVFGFIPQLNISLLLAFTKHGWLFLLFPHKSLPQDFLQGDSKDWFTFPDVSPTYVCQLRNT